MSNCCNFCRDMEFSKSDGLVINLPTLIKASVVDGHRVIQIEASCQSADSEGDIITQKALLDSSIYFIKNGHLDIDHYSELANDPQFSWLGIRDGDEWKIGKPIDVHDLGNYRTGVKAEIFSNDNGEFNPSKNKYDWLWDQLQRDPTIWKASVFGYPGTDTQHGGCIDGTDGMACATRYLVKSFTWKSLALTRKPVNAQIKNHVQIVSMKAFISNLGMMGVSPISGPIITRSQLRKAYNRHLVLDCPETNNGKNLTVHTIRGHFIKCENLNYCLSDLCALSLSELIRRDTN